MGNAIGSFVSGFFKVVGELFGTPLDFLSGKTCRYLIHRQYWLIFLVKTKDLFLSCSNCESAWDLICYIENFCVAYLVKMVAVLALLYIVLLFFYLVYKIGCCQCIGRSLFKMLWACLVSFYSSCEYGCMFAWFKLKKAKQMKEEKRRMQDYDMSSSDADELKESMSYGQTPRSTEFVRSLSRQWREQRRRMHLDRSLKPRNHRVQVGITRHSIFINDKHPRRRHRSMLHNIKVITHTSKFVQKGNAQKLYKRRFL